MSQPSDDKLRDDVDAAWEAIKSIFSVIETQGRINESLHERLKQLEGQDGSGKEEATLS